jgi:regulatory protein
MSDSRTVAKSPSAARRGDRRTPKPVTAERLHKAALRYLERYASSAENLRRVLRRRVERSARLHGTDRSEAEGWIDDIVARLAAADLLDDRAYAENRAFSLHRRGTSQRRIAAMLRQKGVGDDEIGAALRSLAAAAPVPDLAAAVRLARRRRLGPWRDAADRAERRERDLAALARAGFAFDLARRVVDAETTNSLDNAVGEAGDS